MEPIKSGHRQGMEPETRRGLVEWSIKALSSKVLFAAILFLSAGRLDWVWGWAYISVFAAFDLASAVLLIPRHPQLLIERSRVHPGTKMWDKVILRLAAGYLPIATWIIAGLDVRYGWSQVSLGLRLVALVATALGYAIILWAMIANAFFSIVVRVQTDRGHTVATGGPYQYVRHPGYAGAILYTLLLPILLGSWWAFIPGGLSAVLYIVRTALEDQTLQAELPGYLEYTRQVHDRLLPFVW